MAGKVVLGADAEPRTASGPICVVCVCVCACVHVHAIALCQINKMNSAAQLL